MKRRIAGMMIGVTTMLASLAATAGPATLEVINNDTQAMLTGEIYAGLSRDIEALPRSVHTLILFSHGGNLWEARQSARILRQRGITTYAPNDCDSACVVLFAGGCRRIAGDKASFFVHGGITPRELRVKKGWDPQSDERANAETRSLLIDLGVDARLTESVRLPRSVHERLFSAQDAIRYRLATEIGRVFFYLADTPPTRP